MTRQGRWVFDRAQTGQGRAFLGEAQQLDRRTVGEKRDRGEVAPQDSEKIQLPMRQIVDAVTVEIDLRRAFPLVADAFGGKAIEVPFRAPRLDRVQVPREDVFGET